MERHPPQPASPDAPASGVLGAWRELWKSTPAWRLLVRLIAALVAAGVAMAVVAYRREIPAPAVVACGYKGGTGRSGEGRVDGFLSPEQAAELLAASQANTGARINPNNLGNPRVVITMPNGERTVVIQPAGMVVKPGDRVAYAGYHRDRSLACGYVPNLIIGVLQPP